MKEYNTLEETEEKLLGMLDEIRREEGYLKRALNDDMVTDNEVIGQEKSSLATEVDATTSIAAAAAAATAAQNEQSVDEEQNKIDSQVGKQSPQEESTPNQAQPEIDEAPATATQEAGIIATRPTKRYRRGRARAVMDNETDANKRGQQIEQQRLARQRLENALFAEDDDDDDDDSSAASA